MNLAMLLISMLLLALGQEIGEGLRGLDQERSPLIVPRRTTQSLDSLGQLYGYRSGEIILPTAGGKASRIMNRSAIGGADKDSRMHNYLHFYERILADKPTNARLLELGVRVGESLVMWSAYFCVGEVFGMDISLDLWKQNGPQVIARTRTGHRTAHITTVEADATSESGLEAITRAAKARGLGEPAFDVIVDDASHNGPDIVAAFEQLFPHALKRGGTYIMEDVHWYLGYHHVANYTHSLERFVWLCASEKRCPLTLGARKMAEFEEKDWRFQIESISYHRDVIVIRKKPESA